MLLELSKFLRSSARRILPEARGTTINNGQTMIPVRVIRAPGYAQHFEKKAERYTSKRFRRITFVKSNSRRPYGQIRHFSARALGLLLGFLYDRMECPEHSDSIGKLLEPSELVL